MNTISRNKCDVLATPSSEIYTKLIQAHATVSDNFYTRYFSLYAACERFNVLKY
jgi:hypothetical protein